MLSHFCMSFHLFRICVWCISGVSCCHIGNIVFSLADVISLLRWKWIAKARLASAFTCHQVKIIIIVTSSQVYCVCHVDISNSCWPHKFELFLFVSGGPQPRGFLPSQFREASVRRWMPYSPIKLITPPFHKTTPNFYNNNKMQIFTNLMILTIRANQLKPQVSPTRGVLKRPATDPEVPTTKVGLWLVTNSNACLYENDPARPGDNSDSWLYGNDPPRLMLILTFPPGFIWAQIFSQENFPLPSQGANVNLRLTHGSVHNQLTCLVRCLSWRSPLPLP